MVTLDLGPELKLPALEAQTQTFIVYGGKGMGKSSSIAVFCEELDRHKLRFSLLDPVGVSWGLKHSANGKGPGIDVLILGGIHADLPIEPTAGAVVADFVVDEDVSVIIDISRKPDGRMWSHNEQIKFVRDYCTQLFARNGERRRPLMQLIDECGRFAPEQTPAGAVDLMLCKSSIEQLVEWGRNVGIGVYLSTQRSARMAKSVSELADVMIAFRTIGPRSINSIVDWFGEHIDKTLQKDYINGIRSLDRGVAMVVSPGWLHIEGAFALRARQTFDSSATPVAGQERKPSGKGTRLPDLGKYRALMAETIERAEQSDPRALQRRITELEKQVTKAEKNATSAPPVVESNVVTETVKVVPDEVWAVHALLIDVKAALNEIEKFGRTGVVVTKRAMTELDKAKRATATQTPTRTTTTTTRPSQDVRTAMPSSSRATVVPEHSVLSVAGDVKLGLGERKVLNALAQYPDGLDRARVAFLAGYSKRASTIDVVLSKLRKLELVTPGTGAGGVITLTPAGVDAAGGITELPTGDELLAYWHNHKRVGSGERKVLDALIQSYPDDLTRAELCDAAGYSPDASTIDVILSKLRKLGLVQKGARVLVDEFAEAIAS